MKEFLVYIAGPLGTTDPWTNAHNAMRYDTTDPWTNAHNAMRYGQRICELGYVAVVPHEHILWATVCPGNAYQEWIRRDLAVLRRCDCLIRLPGESAGADREVKEAIEFNIPWTQVSDLEEIPRTWLYFLANRERETA